MLRFCRPFVFITLRIAFSASPFLSQPSELPGGVPPVSSVLRHQRPCAFSPLALQKLAVAEGHQKRRAMYSRIMCFQYGQSCPPSGPQLSSEWRIPFPARISERRYDGPEFSHWPVPVAI